MILPGFPMPLIGGAVEPVEFVAATGNHTNTTSVSVNVPSGTSAGDLMVAIVTRYTSTTTPSAVSGWSLVFQDNNTVLRTAIYTRVATESEPASYSFGQSGTSNIRGQIVTLRNATDINIGALARDTANTIIAPSIAMGVGSYLLGYFAIGQGFPTVSSAPSGMTLLQDPNSQIPRCWVYGQSDVGNPSGSRSITWSFSTDVLGFLIEVHP